MRPLKVMVQPRYKSRSHYRTRGSAQERSPLDTGDDLGATALDRPLVDLAALPPRKVPRDSGPRVVASPDLPSRRRSRPVGWVATAVLVACALSGALLGAALALARCA